MESVAKSAFDSFNAFPIIQWAIAAAVFYGIWATATRGLRDNTAKPETPSWIIAGPLHDMMGAVHDVAEECRRTNDLLRDIRDVMGDILRENQTARQTLELIRNESRLR